MDTTFNTEYFWFLIFNYIEKIKIKNKKCVQQAEEKKIENFKGEILCSIDVNGLRVHECVYV